MSKVAWPRTGTAASVAASVCRARLYPACVLTPRVPIMDWLSDLDATLEQSEHPFPDYPIVLDLAAVQLSPNAIIHLVNFLEERRIRILGIEGSGLAADAHARLPPVLYEHSEKIDDLAGPTTSPATPRLQKGRLTSLLIDDFVRSGQCVGCTDGDVTVVGSVGSGAEIVAAGSIHIYGTLRGRAMAGSRGNTRARIFCQRLEAELLAIGPYFKTADEIHEDLHQGPVQIWLEETALRISVMN